MSIPKSWNTIDKALEAFKRGEKGTAFTSVSRMRIRCLTSDDKRVLAMAGEIINLKTTIYEQMGYKKDVVLAKAESIFVTKIVNKEEK